MKIKVNYDLIDKIRASKTGISLKRTVNKTIGYTSIYCLLSVPEICVSPDPLEACLKFVIKGALVYSSMIGVTNLLCVFLEKNHSISDLKKLASLLRENYINTDYELLLQAYQYDVNYSFMLDDNKIPRLKQEKYIMVPTIERDSEKEVSLVQEHLIGSNEYELSYGSPSKSKVLKPVFNGI